MVLTVVLSLSFHSRQISLDLKVSVSTLVSIIVTLPRKNYSFLFVYHR